MLQFGESSVAPCPQVPTNLARLGLGRVLAGWAFPSETFQELWH